MGLRSGKPTKAKAWLWLTALGVYGGVLSFVSFLAAGAGDGTYVIAVVTFPICSLLAILFASAVNSTLGVLTAFLGPIVWWSGVGLVLNTRMTRRTWIALAVVLISQYALALALILGWPFVGLGKFLEFVREPVPAAVFIGGLFVFLVGQVAIWNRWLKVEP